MRHRPLGNNQQRSLLTQDGIRTEQNSFTFFYFNPLVLDLNALLPQPALYPEANGGLDCFPLQ